MKTRQLNARIHPKAYAVLSELTKKLRTTKGHLTERAIYLLKGHFDALAKGLGREEARDVFLSLLGKSMEQYDELYRKLAK